MDLGNNIKILRVSKKLSQKNFAEEIGITPTYLSMIENGSKEPSLTLAKKISNFLGIPLYLLFTDISLLGKELNTN